MPDLLGVMAERPLAKEWEAQADAWARWTRTPGQDHHFSRYNLPSFLQLIPSVEGTTLDVGCGEGRVGVALRQRGYRMVGVDSAPSLARLATETGAYEQVVVADAAALPFPDRVFDLAIAFMSLQDRDRRGRRRSGGGARPLSGRGVRRRGRSPVRLRAP